MTDQSPPNAMQRKAGAGRPPPDVQAMSAAKALRLSIARAAKDIAGLVVTVTAFEESRMTLGALADAVPDPALLAVMDAPDGGQGLFVMDSQVIAGLIEHLATGTVRQGPSPARKPTPTDAILAQTLIDGLMTRFEDTVAEAAAPPDIAGFRFGAPLPDTRAIALALPDIRYRYYRAELMLGQGAKTGEIAIMLPLERPKAPRAQGGDSRADWAENLAHSVGGAEIGLNAVLYRARLPLAEVMGFAPGALVVVPRDALGAVELVAGDGPAICQAKLGQAAGFKALRLRIVADAGDAPHFDAVDGFSAPPALPAEAPFAPGIDDPASDNWPAPHLGIEEG